MRSSYTGNVRMFLRNIYWNLPKDMVDFYPSFFFWNFFLLWPFLQCNDLTFQYTVIVWHFTQNRLSKEVGLDFLQIFLEQSKGYLSHRNCCSMLTNTMYINYCNLNRPHTVQLPDPFVKAISVSEVFSTKKFMSCFLTN